jgi:hypothetical protein
MNIVGFLQITVLRPQRIATRRWLVACLLTTSLPSLAAGNDRFQVHGFLAQAAFYTSDNNLHGESSDGISTDYNEAGINAAWSMFNYPRAPNLLRTMRLSGQLTARNDGKSDNGEVRTDYFNFDWQFLARDAWHLGTRVGRVRNIYGLYNDTRDVAHTRPGITLPAVIYLEQVRDVFVSRDGYALYGDYYTAWGAFSFDGGRGDLPVDDSIVSEALLTEIDAEADHPHTDQFHMRWDSPSGEWRLAYSYQRFSSDIEYTLDGTFALTMNLLSAQYTAESWQWTFEYLRFLYDVNFLLVQEYPGEVAWTQYTYFLPNSWQVFARYEYAVFDRDHRNGSSMEPIFPRHVGYRRDAGVGVRWDIDQHWMVAAEMHYLEGVLGISITDNDLSETQPYWTMAAFEVAFRF